MKRTFAALILMFVASTLAAMPIEFIKDLDLTNGDYEDLNALHGIPWNEGIVENYGELLPQDDPLRMLILKLFHRAGTFDPSTSPRETACSFHDGTATSRCWQT